jgi:hypothetical protein
VEELDDAFGVLVRATGVELFVEKGRTMGWHCEG